MLNYDYQRQLTPELKSEVEWMVKQFAKIGVQLEVRATDYNRFQEKAERGPLQIFWWGWFADYPDADDQKIGWFDCADSGADHGNEFGQLICSHYD